MNYAFLVTSMSVTVTNIQCKCHQNLNFDTNIIVAGFQSSLKIKNLNGTWAWQKWMTINHKLLFHFQTFSKFLWFFSLYEQAVFLRNYFYWFKYYFFGFSQRVKKFPSDDLRMKFTWDLKFHTRLTPWLSDKMVYFKLYSKKV